MFHSPPNKSAGRDNNDSPECSGCNVVISELLAFVSSKVDTLAETAILQICTSAYSDNEIETARLLALKLLAPTKKVMRRKEGNQRKSIQEIIKIIKESDPDSLPTFVVKDLNKLPPVTFDHIDVTTFLKEMSVLKKEIASIQRDYSRNESPSPSPVLVEFESLKVEIQQLKQLVHDIRAENCLISQQNEKQDSQSFPLSLPSSNCCADNNTSMRVEQNIETVATAVTVEFDSRRPECGRPVVVGPEWRGEQSTSSRATGARESITAEVMTQPTITADDKLYVNKRNTVFTMADVVRNGAKLQNTTRSNNGEGWTKVQYGRNRMKNRRGVAQPLNEFNFRAADRTVSLYVSRVHKETTPTDIEGFIKHKTNLEVKVYKINTVDNQFNAFKVVVPLKKVDLFLNDNGDQFWPADIVFRRYWERSHTQKKITGPSKISQNKS